MNATIRIALTLFLVVFAFLVLPLLYTGVPSGVQFRHDVSVLDLQDSVARPQTTHCASEISRRGLLRLLCAVLLLLTVVVVEVFGLRPAHHGSIRLWCERTTYCVWAACFAFMYFLMYGIIAIFVTI